MLHIDLWFKIVFDIVLFFIISVRSSIIEIDVKPIIGAYREDKLGYNKRQDEVITVKAVFLMMAKLIAGYCLGGIAAVAIMLFYRATNYYKLKSHCMFKYDSFCTVDRTMALLPEKCKYIQF